MRSYKCRAGRRRWYRW